MNASTLSIIHELSQAFRRTRWTYLILTYCVDIKTLPDNTTRREYRVMVNFDRKLNLLIDSIW